MKKKILLFLFIILIFMTATDFVDAKKKEYKCMYSNGTIKAEFRLRLGSDGLTKAEEALISGDQVSKSGKYNNETVVNWSIKLKGTSFIGKQYYSKNTKCPPYAYFFDTKNVFTGYKFLVSNEASGGNFEKKIKDKYKVKGQIYVLKLSASVKEEITEDEPTSCMDFGEIGDSGSKDLADKYSCEHNPYFSCVWNETTENPDGGYCNTDKLQYVKCGDTYDIPYQAPQLISFAVNFLKILTPIILIIISIIALLKALVSSNEDEIKKAQKSLIRRIVAAVLVFFVISIVQFVIMKVADEGDTESISSCLSCFLNNDDCSKNIYYKTNVGGMYICNTLSGEEVECEN